MNDDESNHAVGHSQTERPVRTRAKTKITVQSSEANPYDQTATPTLMELRLSETFSDDINGESPVRALQVLRDDHSASLVSVQPGTDALSGLRGEGGFEGEFGKRSDGTLDYWFE